MTPADRELHLALIRHFKGMVKAYERWVQDSSKNLQPGNVPRSIPQADILHKKASGNLRKV